VRAAGGVAVLLPPDEPASAGAVLDAVDGLVLSGGADVDPQQYGAQRLPATGPARGDRDRWEIALAREAIARDLPVLAICRGMQVLNVALGGELRQHVPDDVGHDLHCPSVGVHGRHVVVTGVPSATNTAIGERAEVATYHHQAVGRLGADLIATAWAEDGVIEAIELPGRAWVVGVQWHPEAHDGTSLFAAFVGACRAAKVP
jgi:putative glutamine amidotransferase